MLKIKQNVVLLMEPCDSAADVSLKAGNMLLNRFCIDEDAAFESTGVYYLKEQNTSWKWEIKISPEEMLGKKVKGQRKKIPTIEISGHGPFRCNTVEIEF